MAKKSMIMENDLHDALSWIETRLQKGKVKISYEERSYLIAKAISIWESSGHLKLTYKFEKEEEVSVYVRCYKFEWFIYDFCRLFRRLY